MAVVSEVGSSVPARSTSPPRPASRRSRSRRCAAFFTSASRSVCEHSPSVTGSWATRLGEFQCVRSRIWAMVGFVVPTSRMSWLSLSSGWLRSSQRTAFGRSWRRDTGTKRGPLRVLTCGTVTLDSASLSECEGSSSPAWISSRVSWPLEIGSMPLMPWATSPSAMPLTSSTCSPQKAAICSKDSDVFSTSQTAVALGISGLRSLI